MVTLCRSSNSSSAFDSIRLEGPLGDLDPDLSSFQVVGKSTLRFQLEPARSQHQKSPLLYQFFVKNKFVGVRFGLLTLNPVQCICIVLFYSALYICLNQAYELLLNFLSYLLVFDISDFD